MNSDQQPPRPDPLIDEVRRIRKAISDAHGNDVHRLWEHLQEVQQRHAERVVKRPARTSNKSSGDVA